MRGSVLLALALVASGCDCGDDDDVSADGDADADVDAGDGDADTDADGDADWVDPETRTVELEASDEVLVNPERGFYRTANLVEQPDLAWVRDEGYTLVHAYVRLDDYRDRDLDASLLDALRAGLDGLRVGNLTFRDQDGGNNLADLQIDTNANGSRDNAAVGLTERP